MKSLTLDEKLDDYSRGIICATAYKAYEGRNPYIVARNRDPWPISYLAKILKKKPYFSKSGETYCVKCNGIREKPGISEITDKKAFIRAYVEIHGVLDLTNKKKHPRLRLRIYGNAEIISYINANLPAGEKKMQHISNKIEGGKYTGETEAIYYQSEKEILAILEWMDGTPKNVRIWEQWKKINKKKDE